VPADHRSLRAVPLWLWLALALSLAAQLALKSQRPGGPPAAAELPPPARVEALRLASFGEREAAARVAMLYLQTIDFSAGQVIPYRALDYQRLVRWLRAILELDPRSAYPLFSAARVYAEVPDAERARLALDFVYDAFLHAPDRRWPWLAHAALLAKHRLKDLALARRYAAAVALHATGPAVPLWARQMEIFILEDMNELEAAKVMLGGLLASGEIRDPAEARFLAQRLEELEARLAGAKVK
jgi:hypothetical protein